MEGAASEPGAPWSRRGWGPARATVSTTLVIATLPGGTPGALSVPRTSCPTRPGETEQRGQTEVRTMAAHSRVRLSFMIYSSD